MTKNSEHSHQNLGYQTTVTALIPFPTEDPLQAGHQQWEKSQFINKSRSKRVTLTMKSNRYIDPDNGNEFDSGFLYGNMSRKIIIIIFRLAKSLNTTILPLNLIISEMVKHFGMNFSGESCQNFLQLKKLINSINSADIYVQYDKNPKIPIFDILIIGGKKIDISWKHDSGKIIKINDTFF